GQRRILWISEDVLVGLPEDLELEDLSLRDQRAQQDGDDADHGLGHPSQDEAVHKQPEINRLEAAEEPGRHSPLSNLDELHVGENFGTTPVAGKEEYGQHPAHAESPPNPIPCDSLLGHYAADK